MEKDQNNNVQNQDNDPKKVSTEEHNNEVGKNTTLNIDEVKEITPEEAYRFTMKQFLTGDPTDNIKGIYKLGPKTADKLLDHVPVEDLWKRVIEIWKEKSPRDEWETAFVKCANNIYIRRTIEDLRPKTFTELEEDFLWIQDTGSGEETALTSQSTVDLSTSSDVIIQKNEDFTLEESSST